MQMAAAATTTTSKEGETGAADTLIDLKDFDLKRGGRTLVRAPSFPTAT